MKTLITHARAKLRGRKGQNAHRAIVDNVFSTRDALDKAAEDMTAEMLANGDRVSALMDRNKELAASRRHAKAIAGRLAEFFLPS